jgi:putative oxidoreductase
MKILALICRILLGLMFLVFGLNGFLHFIPMKGGAMPPDAMTWSGIMMTSGWMRIVSTVQALGGLLVLSGVLLPLGLTLLAGVIFNILCFHLFLAGGHGIGMGLFAGLLELLCVFAYREYFRGVFARRSTPAA